MLVSPLAACCRKQLAPFSRTAATVQETAFLQPATPGKAWQAALVPLAG